MGFLHRTRCKRFLAAMLSVASVLSFTGCPRKEAKQPEDEQVIALFQMCPANPQRQPSFPAVEFWFDDSVSMTGYVTLPSAYKTIVSKVVQGAIQSGYESTMRGFSAENATTVDSLVPLLRPDFYRAIATPLASVIESSAASRAPGTKPAGRKIVVIVSDLIQAEGTRDAISVARSLRKAADRFPYVALYGFRSAFQGIYYVETTPRHRVDLEALDGTGRPFYVLIMAESFDDLGQFKQMTGLLELATDRRYDARTFEPSLPPVLVKSVELRTDPKGGAWDPFAAHAQWTCGERFSQIQSYRAKPGRVTTSVKLAFDLQASEQLPIVAPSRYRAEIRRLDPSLARVIPASAARVTATGGVGQASCRLDYELPPLPPGEWAVYSVRLRAGDANVSPPEWMTQWSTDDDTIDRLPDTRNRTLNLITFGEALTRALSEQVVFFDQVLELYRGE